MKIARIIAIFTLITSFFGCNNEDSLLPQVNAGYTYTIIEDDGIVSFINTSDEAIKYVWDFGDNTTSTEINPIKTFASGTYTVKLTVYDASGAIDEYESEIVILRRGPSSLPLNFDESQVKYNFTVFNGVSFKIVNNPSLSGTNAVASKVGEITNIGAAYEGLTFPLDNPIDLTTDKSIKIDVWSDKVLDVLVKLENGTAGNIEKVVSHGGTGWETLTFDYNSSASYSSLTVFIDGPGSTAGKFYIDNVVQIQTPVPPAPLCDAETVESYSAASLNMTFKTDPTANFINDGANFSWASNPDSNNTVNSSCFVGRITKTGTNPWDNTQYNLNSKLDFNANGGLKIKVYSAKAGFKVRIKLEEIGNAGNNTELEKTTTKTNEWEELTFDFATSYTNKFNKIVLFFDLNANNTDQYYFDDLKVFTRVGGGGTGGACTTETAETLSASGLNMTFKTDLTAKIIKDGAVFSWVDNPNSSNTVNPSCKVAKIVKSGQFAWDNNQIDLDAKLDFTANAGLKIKVYSAKAGFKVRIKLEEIGNAGNNTEQELTTTKTNEWEELTFPFATSSTNKFNKIVLFFDLNANNTDTYFFDDLKVYTRSNSGTGTTPGADGNFASNGNFESGDTSGWESFVTGVQGASFTASTSNPKSGSFSGRLLADFAAGNGAAVDAVVKQANLGAGGTAKPNTTYVVSFDLKGSATTGGVFFAEFFSEKAGGGTSKAQIITGGPHPLTTNWTSYSYEVTSGSDVDGGITLQMKSSAGPVQGCVVDVYFDNVSIKEK